MKCLCGHPNCFDSEEYSELQIWLVVQRLMSNSKDNANNTVFYSLAPDSHEISPLIFEKVANFFTIMPFEQQYTSHTHRYYKELEEDDKDVDQFMLKICTKE
jgi:hypothetical protein